MAGPYPTEPLLPSAQRLTLRQRLARAERLLLEDIRQAHAAGFQRGDDLVDEYCRLYAEARDRGDLPEDTSPVFHHTPAPVPVERFASVDEDW